MSWSSPEGGALLRGNRKEPIKWQKQRKRLRRSGCFSDGGKYKGDLFVSVNGVNYQLQRGKNIEVPPEVAEVIRHSQEQDDQTAARMEELANKA